MSGEMIDADIRKAQTLPSRFYTAPEEFQRLKGVFRTWQFAAHVAELRANTIIPVDHIETMTGEPVVLVRGQDTHCLSNVCTHRGMRLVLEPCTKSTLQCRYHGRTFNLDGNLRHMPEFEQAIGFPSEADHLQQFPLKRWMGLYFTAMDDALPLLGTCSNNATFAPGLHLRPITTGPQRTSQLMLYVDNGLEGFHPLRAPELNQARLRRLRNRDPRAVLQIGKAVDDDV